MLKWYLRRGFWDFITWVKFLFAKPVDIRLPQAKWDHINPKPMGEAIPDVPLDNVMVCPPAEIPEDERSWHGLVLSGSGMAVQNLFTDAAWPATNRP